MQKLILTSIIAASLLFLTNYWFIPKAQAPTQAQKITIENPLDHILGEKWNDNGILRKDNFNSILNINARYLSDSSEHYHIQKLRKDLFLLKRKKFYLDNRQYSLIVKTRNKRIAEVHPFVDLEIKDAVYDNHQLFIIRGDYTEIASHWRPNYSITISCLDTNFRELWHISSIRDKSTYFLAYTITVKNEQLLARFGIRDSGSSTICVSDYIAFLSKKGETINFKENGGYLCGAGTSIPLTSLGKLFDSSKYRTI